MWGAGFLPGRGDPGVCLLRGGAWSQSGEDSVGVAGSMLGLLGPCKEGTDVPASLLRGLWKWQELVDVPGTMQGLFILPGQNGYAS